MYKINIVAVGKIKEGYYKEALNEYLKRIGAFAEIKVIEVQEELLKKEAESEILEVIEKEADRIVPQLKGCVIAMAIEGEKCSSTEFSQKLKNLLDFSGGEITFVIGGSYGLSQKVKSKAKLKLSFSNMTFPHTMFRVMLAEQIYRAFTIIKNKSYHK